MAAAAPFALAVTAVRTGDTAALRLLLAEHPVPANARVDGCRTLLHVVADWPGHLPGGAESVATLVAAATLGLLDRVREHLTGELPAQEIDAGFRGACHGGRRGCAEFLLARGAEIDWIPPWERLTPLDAARRAGAADLVAALRDRGARRADEIS